MARIVKKVTVFLTIAVACNLALLYVAGAIFDRPAQAHIDGPRRLVVFAAHQDDGVIMAAGLVMSNRNGTNDVVYLTRTEDDVLAAKRARDAFQAWRLAGHHVALHFLDFVSDRASWTVQKQERAITVLTEMIDKLKPDLMVIPLDEGGQLEHDLLGRLVQEAIGDRQIEVWQAAEYNPYYIASRTPRKILWLLVRLMPFVPYKDLNYGLDPGKQHQLVMSPE